MRSALEELVIIAPQIYSTPYLLKPEIDPSHSKTQQTELDIPLKRDYVQNNVEKGSEDLRFLTKWYVIKTMNIFPYPYFFIFREDVQLPMLVNNRAKKAATTKAFTAGIFKIGA